MRGLKKRMLGYHKVYEQLYEYPLLLIREITKNTGISRNTVSRYIHEMYEFSILKGPLIFLSLDWIFDGFPNLWIEYNSP